MQRDLLGGAHRLAAVLLLCHPSSLLQWRSPQSLQCQQPGSMFTSSSQSATVYEYAHVTWLRSRPKSNTGLYDIYLSSVCLSRAWITLLPLHRFPKTVKTHQWADPLCALFLCVWVKSQRQNVHYTQTILGGPQPLWGARGILPQKNTVHS